MAGRRGARRGRGWDAKPLPTSGDSATRHGSARRRAAASGRGDDDRQAPRAGVPAASAVRAGGRPVPPEEIDPAELAREICLRQLAVRPRTRAELATALRRHGIADEVAAGVLDRYDEVGMIDDAAFARAWVSSRHHGRGLARRALAGELRQRGVDSGTVGEALETLDADTEAATARALVDRRLPAMRRADPGTAFRRLVGMLARKGYPPAVAIRAVKEALAEQDDEAAEFADGLDEDALTDALGAQDDGGPA